MVPHGNYESPARGQLFKQRFWYFWSARGHHDSVVWGVFLPAKGSVEGLEEDICIPKFCQHIPCRGHQLPYPLNGINPAAEFGENRGLVSAAGTYFQDVFTTGELERLGHQCDDVWLGNRLLMAYG